MKKYLVEKLIGAGDFMYIGEYDTTREIAKAIAYSPAKLKNAMDDMKEGTYNRLNGTEYRIGVRRND